MIKVKRGDKKESPALLFLHGLYGNISSMSPFSLLAPSSFHKVFMQAPHKHRDNQYSWWFPEIPNKKQEKQKEESLNYLNSVFTTINERFNIAPKFWIGLGFSQGSVVLWYLLEQRPEFLKGLAILAGKLPEDKKPAEFWKKIAVKPKIFKAHGINDPLIPIEKSREDYSFLKKAGFNVEYYQDEVKHKVGRIATSALKKWLSKFNETDFIN
ncbi:MAG: hypothetical protein D6780_05320 [Candidatus Dadabacteria bacterium]|nr:MAG: hypothetical protein D6780_05320 [Candidatus Dadabacteria bacterium]